MRAVRIAVRKQDFQNHETARYGCEWIDLLLSGTSSIVVDKLQEALWVYITDTEGELQKLNRRDKRRRTRWGRMPTPDRDRAELRRLHLEQMERRRTMLEERRQILRCIGDACAWIVLRADPSTIHALCAGDRTHFLAAEGPGPLGPRCVMESAHASGKFLVLNTDVTRCLGVGDLVAVPTDGLWARPLAFEVKTVSVGEQHAEIRLIGARPVLSHEAEILDRFSRATGFEITDPFPLREREARQAEEIQQGAARIFERLLGITNVLDASCENHWPIVELVLQRTQETGAAFAATQDGIVYAAIRNAPGDDAAAFNAELLQELADAGVRSADYQFFSSLELSGSDSLASIVLPVLLWKLPPGQRIALLNNELHFHSFVRRDVWHEAFGQHGLEWREEHGWWQLTRTGRQMVFQPVQVAKFMFDAAFSALSPDAVARVIAQALDAETP